MLFLAVAALLAPFLFTQCAIAALTPDQVITNIGIVTTLSGDSNTRLEGLTVNSDSGAVQNSATQLHQDLQTIISSLTADTNAQQATSPFTDADAGPIVNALDIFVQVHQVLLVTVIGKHSIFAQFAVTAPIAAVLRSLEATIDSFAFSLTRLIPTQTPAVSADQSTLDDAVGNTISTYNQLCIPSPLYPRVLPVCL